jgi:CRISPR-associated endonuclease/helicase Cas3
MTEILAKSSGETLSEHTINCLNAAQSIINSLPVHLPLSEKDKEELKKDVFLAVAMHDVGKSAKGFQEVLQGKRRNWCGKRHEIISAAFASGIEGVPSEVIFAILTHHKSIPASSMGDLYEKTLPPEQIPIIARESPVWKEMSEDWEENRALFLMEWEKILAYLKDEFSEGSLETSGLKPLSLDPSWLWRSGKKGQKEIIPFDDRLYASIVRGLTIASDHLGSARKTSPKIPSFLDYPVFKPEQFPRPFQKCIGDVEGSAILRAPTGSGKTEAALLWAQKNQMRNSRLFYTLPYTASINAMYKRLQNIFGNNVGLIHHRATAALYSLLESDEDTTSRLDKQETAKALSELGREIYFPVRICTPHQILRYMLRGKGWESMLAEFPSACFIFDEIHAYDPRIVGLTLASARLLIQWGAKCLFISATLPRFLRKLITDNLGDLPFVEPDSTQEEDQKILDKRRHIVEIKEGSLKDCMKTIIESIRNSSSTLIVCNHVKTSQEIYSFVKEALPNENVKLLHSQFNQEDRNQIEKEIADGLPPKVLIATQVVEVSLDMDFELGFFEPAPIDALVQRMGRVNRYGNRPPAKITIFTEMVNPHSIYCNCQNQLHKDNCRVKLTLDALQKLSNKPITEEDLIAVADKIYGDGYQGEDKEKFEEGFSHPDIAKFRENFLAGAYQKWIDDIIDQTDGIVEVLPDSLHNEFERRKEEGLWIEADSLLVPVRVRKIFALKDLIDKKKDPWLIYYKYSHEMGLVIENPDNIL